VGLRALVSTLSTGPIASDESARYCCVSAVEEGMQNMSLTDSASRLNPPMNVRPNIAYRPPATATINRPPVGGPTADNCNVIRPLAVAPAAPTNQLPGENLHYDS